MLYDDDTKAAYGARTCYNQTKFKVRFEATNWLVTNTMKTAKKEVFDDFGQFYWGSSIYYNS